MFEKYVVIGKLVFFYFIGDEVDEFVFVFVLCKFDVFLSILVGGIDYLKNGIFGKLFVYLKGDEVEYSKVIFYLKEFGVVVEEVELLWVCFLKNGVWYFGKDF